MTPELFHEIERSGAAVDLSDRVKLRLKGADHVRYLNGQVTNDVRKALAGSAALHACVTNAKGRIEGDVFIHTPPEGDALCLDAEPVLKESLQARLDRYIVADDVELDDVSDEMCLWHFFGPAAENIYQHRQTESSYLVRNSRLGVAGVDLWFRRGLDAPSLKCRMLSAENMETLRIIRGIPRWPNELNGSAFPQEAGLESSAMDFSKGCYIGQEVLSRIKTTGKMPRVLVRWNLRSAEKIVIQQTNHVRLHARSEDGSPKEIGTVTSACVHPSLDRCMGLGYVRQGFEVAHSLLLADTDEPNIHHDVEIHRT